MYAFIFCTVTVVGLGLFVVFYERARARERAETYAFALAWREANAADTRALTKMIGDTTEVAVREATRTVLAPFDPTTPPEFRGVGDRIFTPQAAAAIMDGERVRVADAPADYSDPTDGVIPDPREDAVMAARFDPLGVLRKMGIGDPVDDAEEVE